MSNKIIKDNLLSHKDYSSDLAEHFNTLHFGGTNFEKIHAVPIIAMILTFKLTIIFACCTNVQNGQLTVKRGCKCGPNHLLTVSSFVCCVPVEGLDNPSTCTINLLRLSSGLQKWYPWYIWLHHWRVYFGVEAFLRVLKVPLYEACSKLSKLLKWGKWRWN